MVLSSSYSVTLTLLWTPRTTWKMVPIRRQALKLKLNLPRQWRSSPWSNRSRGQSRRVLPPARRATQERLRQHRPTSPRRCPSSLPLSSDKVFHRPRQMGPLQVSRKLRPFPWDPRVDQILLRSKPPMSTANWWPAVVRAPAAKRCDPPPRAEPLSFFLVGSIRCSTARSSDCWLSNCPQCTRSGCRCNGTSPFLSRRRVYHPSPPCGPHLRLRNC